MARLEGLSTTRFLKTILFIALIIYEYNISSGQYVISPFLFWVKILIVFGITLLVDDKKFKKRRKASTIYDDDWTIVAVSRLTLSVWAPPSFQITLIFTVGQKIKNQR